MEGSRRISTTRVNQQDDLIAAMLDSLDIARAGVLAMSPSFGIACGAARQKMRCR